MYENTLPFTGAGIAFGGMYFGLPAVVSIATGLVVGGAFLVRLATVRSRRAPR